MFGHTLLRFDRAEANEQTAHLLSYAVNYGAETGEDNGLLFAVLGLTGGYPGTYSVEPYYQLVKRYSDIENRDIFEYQLDFSEDEVAAMVAHLWEVQGHWSEYYFFDENCSYQLLFLLDVARPGLDLASAFDLHVIPVDSVRAVLEQKGLFKKATFRPSGQTRIGQGLTALDASERMLVHDLAAGKLSPDDIAVYGLPPATAAAVIELAETFVTHQMETGDLGRDEAAARALALLTARSRIESSSDLPPIEAPETRPDQGHRSARLGLGFGLRDGRPFESFHLRPAYHDDLDPSGGYVPGAMIDFLAFDLRHYHGGDAVTLEAFTGVGIRSMTPQNALIRPISWHLDTGLKRMHVKNTDEEGALVAAFEGGAGLSATLGARDIWSGTLDVGRFRRRGLRPHLQLQRRPRPLIALADDRPRHLPRQSALSAPLRRAHPRSLRVQPWPEPRHHAQNLAVKLEAGLEDEGSGAEPELPDLDRLVFLMVSRVHVPALRHQPCCFSGSPAAPAFFSSRKRELVFDP